jgi:ribosomal protein L32
MWELLRDNVGITDEQLVSKIREVDMRSGRLDGKAPEQPAECQSCSRTVNARHVVCLYCGAELSPHPFGA